MVEIGGRPILWHILKIYSHHGINDFIICCGYKGYVIKEYFANYFLHMSDVTFELRENRMEVHRAGGALACHAGGYRRRDAERAAGSSESRPTSTDEDVFCMTYGDGVRDVDITAAIAFHGHGKLATLTAFSPRPLRRTRRSKAIVYAFQENQVTADGSTAVSSCSRRGA